uniref:KH domain-containing protein n=1 Tax=Angiostrongylus cantonensis TaxID=6313 RepID=A0A158P625_ANGCA
LTHPTLLCSNISSSQQYSVEYLSQLLKDKKQLSAFPNVFHHLERLADEEISKVRVALFQFEFTKEEMSLPDPEGDVQVTTEKVFVPAKEHPDYNFVGRILGPRGMTAKQLEQETGCKIMVRGRGSMRDKKKEELNRGKPNWEHLSEDLHVLIQCEDTPNRSRIKLARAVDEVKKLLVPAPEGEDELKRKQLMELAIINGTYRSATEQAAAAAAAVQLKQPLAAALREFIVHNCIHSCFVNDLSTYVSLLISLARSPTMAMAGAPIVMSPGRGAAAQQNQMLGLQSQLGAAAVAVSNNAAAVAAQQAAILQQQQQAAEYQQLLLR